METDKVLETIFDAIKDAPLGPCPINSFVMCDVPPRLTKDSDVCFWMQECLEEWEEKARKTKQLRTLKGT